MKKFSLTLLGLGLAGVVGSVAAPLTPQQAVNRSMNSDVCRAPGMALKSEPVYTVKTSSGDAAAYVFIPENGSGYRILAGDDVAFPVLGYSDSGMFDPDNIPSDLKWWLGEYARQIQLAQENGFPTASAPAAGSDWHEIAPLVKSKWDQGAPYNIQCPTPKNSTVHCYTGCVATSMAQVMNYFKYPEVGEGSISYKPGKLGKTLMLVFSKESFDWDNMLDNYVNGSYNDDQANAVAYLMKACGYSVQMNYGTDASGAVGSSIGASLKKYFKYDEGCRSEERILYSMSTWTQMVYDNLDQVGPVIINGRDFDGSAGHSFICDGYDGNGYFHFNWGWSGISDGYYSLDALNPDAMGVGGYGGGFNNGQNAIFGIQPPTGVPYTPVNNILQYGNMAASVSGNTIVVGTKDYASSGWGNPFDYAVSGELGLNFSGNGTDETVVASIGGRNSVSLDPGYYYSYPHVDIRASVPLNLQDGEYIVKLVFKGTDESVWKDVVTVWGYNSYVYMTKAGANYTITEPAMNKIEVQGAEIASEIYYGKNTLFKVTYKNDSAYELSQGVVPRLYKDGVVCMEGSGVLVTVDAESTEEKQFISRFYTVGNHSFTGDSEYDFCLYDPTNGVLYGNFGTVTMKKAPSKTSLMQTKLEIENETLQEVEYGTLKRQAYVMESTDDFIVDFDYMCRFGYFDGRIKMGVYEVNPDNVSSYIPVIDEVYSVSPFMSAGQTGTAVVEIKFPEAQPGVLYAIRTQYSESSSWNVLGTSYFITGHSGIRDIIDENDGNAEYFNLQGLKIVNPAKGQILIRKQGERTEKVRL